MTRIADNPASVVPANRLLAWIMAVLVLGLAATALVVLASGNRPGWWQAWAAAALIGLISAAASVPLLVMGLKRIRHDATAGNRENLHSAVLRLLLAGVMRVVVVAVGVVLSVEAFGTARWPTFAFAGGLYLLLMIAEVGLVGRSLWRADARRAGQGQREGPRE